MAINELSQRFAHERSLRRRIKPIGRDEVEPFHNVLRDANVQQLSVGVSGGRAAHALGCLLHGPIYSIPSQYRQGNKNVITPY